jgi:hypothetical protein
MNDEQETQPVDLESLFQDEVVNSEQVNQTIRDSGAPAGTYTSDPEAYPLSVFPEVREEKGVNGDVTGQRKCATIMGLFTGTFEGKEVRTRIRIRLSPDYRRAKVYEGDQWTGEFQNRPDSQSKLYAQAVKVYEAKVKETPKNVLQVIEFLRENPFRVRTMVGRDGEPVVLAISPAGRR